MAFGLEMGNTCCYNKPNRVRPVSSSKNKSNSSSDNSESWKLQDLNNINSSWDYIMCNNCPMFEARGSTKGSTKGSQKNKFASCRDWFDSIFFDKLFHTFPVSSILNLSACFTLWFFFLIPNVYLTSTGGAVVKLSALQVSNWIVLQFSTFRLTS